MTQHRWRNWTEYALLLGSGAGTAASVVTQQLLFASAPLTVLVAMGMLNRRRLEQQVDQATEGQIGENQRLLDDVSVLQERVAGMPTPESLTDFQRSVMAHSDRAILRFSREIDKSRQHLEQRMQAIEAPDLSQFYEDMGGLQAQYNDLCSSLNTLTNQVQRLSKVPRMEAAEGSISHLKTEMMQMRVSLENLGADTKTNLSTLQNSVSHFERRLRQAQPQSDPGLIKEEVHELIKTVSDLVPRRDFMVLSDRLQAFSQQQASLKEALQNLQSAAMGQPTTKILTPQTASPEVEIAAQTQQNFQRQIDRLNNDLIALELRLNQGESPQQLQSTVQQSVTDYVSRLQAQIDYLAQVNQALSGQQQEIQQLLQQLSGMPAEGSLQGALPELSRQNPLADQITSLNFRIELTEAQLDKVQQQLTQVDPQSSVQSTRQPTDQWIVDFQVGSNVRGQAASGSRRSLEHAIAQTQERLIVVWPWAESCELDELMVNQFRQLLVREGVLEIGWCHVGDRREGRLLAAISQRWKIESTQKQLLKQALNQLLPLKQEFPDQFKFKILGTDENFLVCDRHFAVLGVEPMQTGNSVFPRLGLKLHTDDRNVVQQLTQRFDAPTLDSQDVCAYFNRGITRYDLGDLKGALLDFNQVIQLDPQDGVAYTNCGVIYAQLGQIEQAIASFSQAIHHEPCSFAAYCNRGYFHLEQGNYFAAIDDFDQAIQCQPSSPIPYFYRGSARQKQGALRDAIADYSAAIERNRQNIALPYCYRSAAYQKQAAIDDAIADLEVATQYLEAQNDPKNLALLRRTLEKLYRTHTAVV